jgi:hypothetical protein
MYITSTAGTHPCPRTLLLLTATLSACVHQPRADTAINLKGTLVNTGNVKLRQVAWNLDWAAVASTWGASSCTIGPTGAGVTSAADEIPVGEEMVCTGTFEFTQDVMEQGATKRLTSGVGFKVTDALAALAPAAAATQLDITVVINPKMTVDLLDNADCFKPYRAGEHVDGCSCWQVLALVFPYGFAGWLFTVRHAMDSWTLASKKWAVCWLRGLRARPCRSSMCITCIVGFMW